MRTRSAIRLSAVGVVALLLLREAGVIDLNWNASRSESKYRSEWSTDAKQAAVSGWSKRVEFDEEETSMTPVVVQAASATQFADIVIHIDPLDVQGCPWLPLYKWGSCSFRARATRNGMEWGTMEGTIETTVKGLASSHFVRQSLREEIRKHVWDTVDSWMRP